MTGSKTFHEQAKLLERAWLRLYCAAVPKAYRRTWLRETIWWGPLGASVFIPSGLLLRLLDAATSPSPEPPE